MQIEELLANRQEIDADVVDAMVRAFRKRGMDEQELATGRIAKAR